MATPLASLFSVIDSTKRRIKGQSAEQLADVMKQSIDEFNRGISSSDSKQVEKSLSSILDVISPAGLGTIVSASPAIKGMKGVHPKYNPEAAPEGIPNSDLWRDYGVFRDKAGVLKTNVSDVGTKLKGIPDKPGASRFFFDTISHPNEETLRKAEPTLADILVEFTNTGSVGSYSHLDRKIKVNVPKAAAATVSEFSDLGLADRLVSTLIHEGGHNIQRSRGWGRGANTQKVRDLDEFVSALDEMKMRFPDAPVEEQEQKAAIKVYKAFTGEQESSAAQKVFRRGTVSPDANEWDVSPTSFMLPDILQIYSK